MSVALKSCVRRFFCASAHFVIMGREGDIAFKYPDFSFFSPNILMNSGASEILSFRMSSKILKSILEIELYVYLFDFTDKIKSSRVPSLKAFS